MSDSKAVLTEEKKLILGEQLVEEAKKNRVLNLHTALEKWKKEVIEPVVKRGRTCFTVQTIHFQNYFDIEHDDRDGLRFVQQFLKEQGITATQDTQYHGGEDGNAGSWELTGTMTIVLGTTKV
jgi:hypothetical protein